MSNAIDSKLADVLDRHQEVVPNCSHPFLDGGAYFHGLTQVLDEILDLRVELIYLLLHSVVDGVSKDCLQTLLLLDRHTLGACRDQHTRQTVHRVFQGSEFLLALQNLLEVNLVLHCTCQISCKLTVLGLLLLELMLHPSIFTL